MGHAIEAKSTVPLAAESNLILNSHSLDQKDIVLLSKAASLPVSDKSDIVKT